MKKTTVYDLPTRLFHWFFAALFLAAFIIAETVDDESSVFSYHMLAGLTMVFLLFLRVIWGFAGTTYARFSSFKLNPAELIRYLRDAVFTKTKRYLSHNPASSYAAILMFIFTIGLAFTGIMMAGVGGSDVYEEVHEILANLFLITVIAHVAGMIFHHFKHKEPVWFSMVDGKKNAVSGEKGIAGTKPVAGILFIIITLSWAGYLNARYDSSSRTLDLFGTELILGEEEHESHSAFEDDGREDERYEHDDEDEDD